MDARKITVVQTKNQKKSVIMSAATTLAELKSDLRANGIDYDGMTFFEGTSKVELKNDASVLMFLTRELSPMSWFSCLLIPIRKFVVVLLI